MTTPTAPLARARVVPELTDGTIVAAGDTDISLIRNDTVEKALLYGDKLSNTMILTLLELANKRLPAGTDSDGMVIIHDGEVIRKLTRKDGLNSGIILRTVADPGGDGVLIVTSNGLCYMDEGINAFEADDCQVFIGDYIGVNPNDSADTYDLRQGFTENATSSAPGFHYVLKDAIAIE